MKTGIIRRVDDLGRVVIPKEIRGRLGIKEGVPLEISLENGSVCFTPYCVDARTKIATIIEDICITDYEDDKQNEILNNIDKLREIAKSFERLGV